jgi:valyl-tRNA synthetase
MLAAWPKCDPVRDDQTARGQMDTLIALITKIRNIRSEMNIPPQSRLKLYIATTDLQACELVDESSDQISARRGLRK